MLELELCCCQLHWNVAPHLSITLSPPQRVLPLLSVTSMKQFHFLLLSHLVINPLSRIKSVGLFSVQTPFPPEGLTNAVFVFHHFRTITHRFIFLLPSQPPSSQRFGHSILFLDKFPHSLHS